MDFFNDIFHNLALLEFYFFDIIYIILYIDFILSIFFQHSNILTRASHHWCLASNIVLVLIDFADVTSLTMKNKAHGVGRFCLNLNKGTCEGRGFSKRCFVLFARWCALCSVVCFNWVVWIFARWCVNGARLFVPSEIKTVLNKSLF